MSMPGFRPVFRQSVYVVHCGKFLFASAAQSLTMTELKTGSVMRYRRTQEMGLSNACRR